MIGRPSTIRSVITLTERLRSAGVRLSAQRRIVAECLDGQNRHVTAEELLVESQSRLPEIGRATVYKALAAFVEAGAVRSIQVDDGAALFDPNAHVDHHHLVCERCGGIWDIPATRQTPPGDLGGFTITQTDVKFLGMCAACDS